MDHEAIYSAYSGTVVTIDDSAGAFDKDGNKVTLDDAKVAAARKINRRCFSSYQISKR